MVKKKVKVVIDQENGSFTVEGFSGETYDLEKISRQKNRLINDEEIAVYVSNDFCETEGSVRLTKSNKKIKINVDDYIVKK